MANAKLKVDSVDAADTRIAKLDAQISQHGKTVAKEKAAIQKLNAEKNELLTVREALVRLGDNPEVLRALGIETAEKVGD